jgi:GDP-4-dehydro-6-deoxy-D-mannose reductase
VLVAGSAAQYGLGAQRPLSEEDPSIPVSAYGAVKSVIERAVTADGLRDGVRIIFTRSFNHVGPGQGPEAPAAQWARDVVAAEAACGGTIRVGDLDVVRDFLDVRDVADAYLALVRSTAAGIVNVCSGVATPLHAVASLLAAGGAAPVTVEHDPTLLRGVDPPYVVGDPALLRELTDWSPAIGLEQSLDDLLADLRRHAGRRRVGSETVGS